MNVTPYSTLETLEGQLASVSTSYLLGVSALDLLANQAARNTLIGRVVSFGPEGMTFSSQPSANSVWASLDQIAHLLSDKGTHDEAIKQYAIVLLRDLVTLGFQLVEERCNLVGARMELEATPFFHFVRIIRNCVSHNLHVEYGKFDRTILPLEWRGLTLTLAMDSQPLPLAFFGWAQAWTMHTDFVAFARALDLRLGIAPYPNLAIKPPSH